MSLFSRGSRERPEVTPESSAEHAPAEAAEEPIAGDRGIPSINRARSIQSRVSSVLAMTLMSALGLGLLTWYYSRALTRPAQAQHAAQAAAKSKAQGEMALPSLGPIASPFARAAPSTPPPEPSTVERILGPAPALPAAAPAAAVMPAGYPPLGTGDVTPPKSPGQLAFERRLVGPAFARSAGEPGEGGGPAAGGIAMPEADGSFPGGPRTGAGAEAAGDPARALNALLRPTVTPAVAASVLPTRRFLLARGAFIDCTLETAIDSTLPGMTTCITATDTFSADGTVVLLERGTKLVGETRGEVAQGTARIFVLWTEARTPTGVVVPLSSPGTDELGRSGLSGEVNRHFWDRFGAAILMTVITGAVQGAVNSQNSSGSVVVSPSTSTDVMTEILRSTVSIPPTVTKAQGDRIQVFVARDVDFRPVYALRVANSAATPEVRP
jgi:type IV secretion system protein VirB10